MRHGTILLFNGTSSSGKTSIIRALRDMREKPAFFVGVDHFNAMRPWRALGDEKISEGMAMNVAFHQAIATLAENGWDVLVEHVLVNPVYLKDCLRRLTGYPVLFIGVHCPLFILEQREQERGDRQLGIAKEQFDRVHSGKIYDIEVNTARQTPDECAQSIQQYLAKGQALTAFQQLQELLHDE